MRNSDARRDGPLPRHGEPLRRHDEPQYDEPSTSPDELRHKTLYDSRTQKRRLPNSTAGAAPTWRMGKPFLQELGRAPPAGAKPAIELRRMLSGKISHAGSTRELLRLSTSHSASLDHIHVANLWNKLGKQSDASGLSHKEEVRRLLRRTVELVGLCKARELSNVAHGLAKCRLVGLDVDADALFATVAEAAVREGLGSFKPQELGNTAWAFAAAGQRAPALLDALAAAALPRLRGFKPQHLSSTAWAFAKAGHTALVLFDAIAAAAVPRLREFNPQELTSTAGAFAKAGHVAPVLLDAIAAVAVSQLHDFQPQGLANMAWAFAKASKAAPALLDAIAAVAAPRLGEFNSQNLANMVWAFAKASHAAPLLLDAIAAVMVPRMRDFNAQDLANTVWAFAKVGHAASALLDAIATVAMLRLRDFKPQELANTAWAFAKAGHAAPALLDAIATVAVPQLRDYIPQDLANMAWAYATAGQPAPVLLDAIATAAAPRLRDFNVQNLANMAWAFAAADHPAPALFSNHVFMHLYAAQQGFVPEDLAQLHQWQLWQAERGTTWPLLLPELALRCRDAFSSKEGAVSKLQRDVVASLLALELTLQEEVRTPQGYSLDAVVVHGRREVAIEVDGPSHFCGRTPTGATALKRRQLRAAGWALLPVPYWEWDALGMNNVAKQQYLREALRGAS